MKDDNTFNAANLAVICSITGTRKRTGNIPVFIRLKRNP
jgi:hypothetical protein